MQRFNHRVIVDTGTTVRWVDAPTVNVYLTGTVTLASIFDDDGITPKANPFTGPSTGLIYFYAADGKYDVVFSGGTPAVSYAWAVELLDDTLSLTGVGGGGLDSLNAQLTSIYADQTLSVGISGSDFNIASFGGAHVFNLPVSSATATGKLRNTDFQAFNAKLGSLNGINDVSQLLAIGTTGTAPNWSSAAGTHTLNIPYASATKNGILSTADWSAFNSKMVSLSNGTVNQYLRGDLTWQNLNSDIVTEGITNLYYTNARARAALSASSPLSYNAGTGAFSIQLGTGAQPGYISVADWTTFNNKMGTLNGLSDVTQSFSVGSSGNDISIASAAATHVFNIPSASSTARGLVNTGPQTIQGPKTFASEVAVSQYIELTEISAVSNAPTDKARLYVKDNGAGKTQLVVVFQSGATQQIAIEP